MLYSSVFKGNPEQFKLQVLNYICTFENALMLDSNSDLAGPIPYTGTRYNFIATAGITDEVRTSTNCLQQLESFIQKYKNSGRWIFGYLGYDLKNEIEALTSENPDTFGFPVLHFFVSQHVIIGKDDQLQILSDRPTEQTWNEILSVPVSGNPEPVTGPVHITYIPGRDSYMEAVNQLLGHIRFGNIYEVNYCHQLLAELKDLDPVSLFRRLNNISPNPFACLYRTGSNYLFSASPERFLTKRRQQLISQPVKGTAPRSKDPRIDTSNRERLLSSEKERSENIMIADLVRNDLSKVAAKGTVKAEEICGAYTYSRVHQLVSTISCELKQDISFTDIIRALFPMGSMTGAPKISAMQLIEKYETFRRSVFSGAVGYIDPEGDFDFNVVIRSILYREDTGTVSIAAGSAITAASDPQTEYDETIIKLAPQLEALGIHSDSLLKKVLDEKPA